MYNGEMYTPDQNKSPPTEMYGGGFEDEPPLLEELGINFDHIWQKTIAVLNPWKHTSSEVINEVDLTIRILYGFGRCNVNGGKSAIWLYLWYRSGWCHWNVVIVKSNGTKGCSFGSHCICTGLLHFTNCYTLRCQHSHRFEGRHRNIRIDCCNTMVCNFGITTFLRRLRNE